MIRDSFVFCALATWFKGVFKLALSNDFSPVFTATLSVLGVTAAELMVTDETFGTTRMVIFLVMCTVFLNTAYGISKSLMTQKAFFAKAVRYPFNSHEYNIFFQRSQRYRFDIRRLQFVFFKCFVFLGYLYFAKNLLEDEGTFLDFTTELAVKVPVAFFWYYEFKSFGENSTVVYEKKAYIFTIIETMFEPKLSRFFGRKTPTDGVHNDIELNPKDYGLNDEILRDNGNTNYDTHDKPEDNT